MLNELAGLGIFTGHPPARRTGGRRPPEGASHCNSRRTRCGTTVAHADETSRRVNDNLYWLHVLSTDRLTAYFPHPKRGAEALDAFGLLTPFAGVLVHDH